ncbi:MAG: hypothetical protein ACFCVD_10355 [Nodosilinea sp.]
MRVWALASCGGLLALTSCSTEPSSPPQANTVPAGRGSTADIEVQPELDLATSRAVARPETGQARPLSAQPSQASPLGDQGLSQSSQQLRARLQQIRAQRSRVLSSPRPSAQPQPLATRPTAPKAGLGGQGATNRPTLTAPTRVQPQTQGRSVLPTSQQLVTALPTPARPTAAPAAPNSTLTAPLNSDAGLGATAVSPSGGASPTSPPSGPGVITPSPHQGSSARPTDAVPALTAPVALGLSSQASGPAFSSAGADGRRTHQIAVAATSTATAPGEAVESGLGSTSSVALVENTASAPGLAVEATPGAASTSATIHLSSGAGDHALVTSGQAVSLTPPQDSGPSNTISGLTAHLSAPGATAPGLASSPSFQPSASADSAVASVNPTATPGDLPTNLPLGASAQDGPRLSSGAEAQLNQPAVITPAAVTPAAPADGAAQSSFVIPEQVISEPLQGSPPSSPDSSADGGVVSPVEDGAASVERQPLSRFISPGPHLNPIPFEPGVDGRPHPAASDNCSRYGLLTARPTDFNEQTAQLRPRTSVNTPSRQIQRPDPNAAPGKSQVCFSKTQPLTATLIQAALANRTQPQQVNN